MIAYLDTQVVIWLMQGEETKISRDAKAVFESADLLISPIVTVELEILYELRRTKQPWRDVQMSLGSEIGLRVCDLSFTSVSYAALGEGWTRDPFDRIIVAHAKANGSALLISADEEIRKHYRRAVW